MATDKELDTIYEEMDILVHNECYYTLDLLFEQLAISAWRRDINVLLAYATISYPIKHKLKNRERFIATAKHHFPGKNNDIWIGLE